MLFVTLVRSTVTSALFPAPLGDTRIPIVPLFENSLSRTSTLTVPAPGSTRIPSVFERTTVPAMRTDVPPSIRIPAAPTPPMLEITLFSTCTSPACTRIPLSPPWPLIESPRSTTLVAGALTRTPSCPANTEIPAYTPAGLTIDTFLSTTTAP